MIEVILCIACWLSLGVLVYYWGMSSPESTDDNTIGEFLLIVAVGPIFLPILVLSFLAQLKMPKRRALREKPEPRWQQEAEREVDSWLSH